MLEALGSERSFVILLFLIISIVVIMVVSMYYNYSNMDSTEVFGNAQKILFVVLVLAFLCLLFLGTSASTKHTIEKVGLSDKVVLTEAKAVEPGYKAVEDGNYMIGTEDGTKYKIVEVATPILEQLGLAEGFYDSIKGTWYIKKVAPSGSTETERTFEDRNIYLRGVGKGIVEQTAYSKEE